MIWKHKAWVATSKLDKSQAGGNSTGKLGEQKNSRVKGNIWTTKFCYSSYF